ncbi:TIGR02206 family membrane protein [Sporosarcina sp. ACRSL]|uniref:YwaF family protein n=1 Tax=Sporosarcina sp. ACRSL TaxID=2918215 RepID=UPI001EF6C64D|nr:TIGR02206 family membrane protein [Sporosarcina sp. ACRSL]MCG7345218.1 TIGR02206 family membrane protein [Sporosarcina sp. ACRSL]
MGSGNGANHWFVMFSFTHFFVLFIIALIIVLLFTNRKRMRENVASLKVAERLFAISLLAMDIAYHIWLIVSDRWRLEDALPLELCSISLLVSIVLLLTGNRYLVDFVIFAGIGGALQALATPVLDMDYPHFRFFHFFYTHAGIILTGLYYVWVKGYEPTFKGVLKTMLILNAILPFILVVNWLFDGNYMFLRMKPENGSILDFLGPYPWYLLSLEMVAFLIFTVIWLLLRNKGRNRVR